MTRWEECRFDDRGHWRDAKGRFAPLPAGPLPMVPAPAPRRWQVTVFGTPRAPWRDSRAAAMRDAIRLDLASWDESRREYFLAVPVAIRCEVLPKS